ncbi:nucleoside deaminase [Martelella sp. AD-3]|uniref:nucleoside deaminase n=1 Tax=Martelella sp. AD-3 TaxID=686597 RepID=UPI00046352BB|nr:nucleoside deaminase [Martelella sp. AD-3]AMM84660.1 cytidine deaminase [Martelella sp. AD-3]MAM11546.1 nucleoside deaminase [Rhizobiaceae bacterium]|tara:strand:- start:76 stop:663 length:588 start_codon:yes stop_codon:yes gene_type:complete
MNDALLTERLLNVIEQDILPLTSKGVEAGNKVFGAAILRKSDLSLVIAGTNDETANPLWHGEVHTLKQFYELPVKPDTKELLFLSTHEPCTMCMSAITWAGFDNYFYFFSHEDSRDSFGIPHDLKIMKELYGLEPGGYRRHNAFFEARSIVDMANAAEEPESSRFLARVERIKASYALASETYQSHKGEANIPLD